MKKLFRNSAIILLVLVLAIAGVLSYIKFALPDVGQASDLKILASPEMVQRGEYLANHVTVCIDCHSERDGNLFSGPIVPGSKGKGGEVFDQQFGFPGRFTAKNITPYGIGKWTDGEIYRAITCGVSKDGHAFFPVMPYQNYRKLDEEDVKSIISYLRTLEPIENKPEESVADFPMNFILNTIPQKASPEKRPAETDILAYGKYMTNAAGCIVCHSKADKGEMIAGMEYAGGFEFPLPGYGIVSSANITPDKGTGIGNWSKETFVNRFKAYSDSTYKAPKVQKGDFQTVMPWTMYAGMKAKDLEAIYTYLMTLKPVNHTVEKFRSETAMK